MKPLLYHLEYHIQNGYFENFPKGQDLKMLVGHEGGIQTLHGKGTGSGKVIFSQGKSVLFAMDSEREAARVVFRVYSADDFLGESVKFFKGTTFPKRSEVGEPGSFTFGTDLGFKKNGEIVGATQAFLRLTVFGENIISDCIKDGDSYRVRLTSLIVERNVDPKKSVKPWWVILDGRRLRFSRWLKTLEKEECTKELFMRVKKSSKETIVPLGEHEENSEESDIMEKAKAKLKKELGQLPDFGYPPTKEIGSQVNLLTEAPFREISNIPIGISENLRDESHLQNENNLSLNCLENDVVHINVLKLNSEEGIETVSFGSSSLISSDDQQQSSYVQQIIEDHNQLKKNDIDENENAVKYFFGMNRTNIETTQSALNNISKENVYDEKIINPPKNINEIKEGNNYTVIKSDDIFHFEESGSDVTEETISTNESTRLNNTIITEKYAVDEASENVTVTDKSFLAETIVREIIDIFIERVSEKEYNHSLQGNLESEIPTTKDENSCRTHKDVGYGDTEPSVEFSGLGIVETVACIELSTATTLEGATEGELLHRKKKEGEKSLDDMEDDNGERKRFYESSKDPENDCRREHSYISINNGENNQNKSYLNVKDIKSQEKENNENESFPVYKDEKPQDRNPFSIEKERLLYQEGDMQDEEKDKEENVRFQALKGEKLLEVQQNTNDSFRVIMKEKSHDLDQYSLQNERLLLSKPEFQDKERYKEEKEKFLIHQNEKTHELQKNNNTNQSFCVLKKEKRQDLEQGSKENERLLAIKHDFQNKEENETFSTEADREVEQDAERLRDNNRNINENENNTSFIVFRNEGPISSFRHMESGPRSIIDYFDSKKTDTDLLVNIMPHDNVQILKPNVYFSPDKSCEKIEDPLFAESKLNLKANESKEETLTALWPEQEQETADYLSDIKYEEEEEEEFKPLSTPIQFDFKKSASPDCSVSGKDEGTSSGKRNEVVKESEDWEPNLDLVDFSQIDIDETVQSSGCLIDEDILPATDRLENIEKISSVIEGTMVSSEMDEASFYPEVQEDAWNVVLQKEAGPASEDKKAEDKQQLPRS